MPDLSDTPRPHFERTATGIIVVQPPIVEKTEPELTAERATRYPQTQKLRDKLDAEMAAGRAAVAAAAEARRLNPPKPPQPKEVAAQGTTVPVFRPEQFVEYAKNFKNQAQTRSKDA
jgi:hypothetical protein